MASQMTHVYYGKKVLRQYLSDQKIDERKFFLGTLFPDIRYLGVIDRDVSHYPHPSLAGLNEIQGDFEKGRYVHALVDIERENLLTKLGAYDLIHGRFVTFAMKFIEDEYTYSLIPDWNIYINYLNQVLPEEEALVPKAAAKEWHTLLQNYFSQKPTVESVVDFSKNLTQFNPAYIEPVMQEMTRIKANQSVMDIIKKAIDLIFET